ncbi:hypothetical protein M5689_013713 [Euphorbia peplus]|nr:hypothetical protein M5689_013713 [Euphorbia peplus]
MDPYSQNLTPYEQRLRDEVLYLHSLWHAGPPHRNPHRPPSRNLPVINPTSFKRTNRRNPPQTLTPRNSTPLPDPGPEWPLDPPPSSPPATSGWVSFEDIPAVENPKVSHIDDPKVAIVRLQQTAMNLCNGFLAKKADSDGEEDDEFFEEDGGNGSLGLEESEEFKFFFSLFVENREMRNFYENSQENGVFYCLLCGGVGRPGGKLFSSCHGLVQHSNQILKTKRKKAHRAFGLVICRVLGWDITRLPQIVLKGQPLSQSLANLGETLNCLKEDDIKKVVEDTDNGACVPHESKVVDIVEGELKKNNDNGDEALEHESRDVHLKNCLKEDDIKKVVEDTDNGACVPHESKVVDIVEGELKKNNVNGDEALELESPDVHLKV